jgi:hypothetical protein
VFIGNPVEVSDGGRNARLHADLTTRRGLEVLSGAPFGRARKVGVQDVFAKPAWALLLGSPQPQARRTSSCQHPQICSSPTTAIATRKVRLKETLCHLGWRVFGRIPQSFPREAVQVRFDEPDYATLI